MLVQSNIELEFFFKTKVMGAIYTSYLSGYWVAVTKAPKKHRGGVAVLYHNSHFWHLEVLQTFFPQISIFQLVMGWNHWHIVS